MPCLASRSLSSAAAMRILLGKEPGGPRQEHGTEAIELAEAGLQAPHFAKKRLSRAGGC